MASRWGRGNRDVGSAINRRKKGLMTGSPEKAQDRLKASQGNLRGYHKAFFVTVLKSCYIFYLPFPNTL